MQTATAENVLAVKVGLISQATYEEALSLC
jgi:hypothetical protein